MKILYIEQIQWKLMKKPFSKFKRFYFWPISPIFEAKKVFPQNWVVMHNFTRVSGIMPKWSNDPISRKHLDRCQEIRMNRPYIIGSFPLPTEV